MHKFGEIGLGLIPVSSFIDDLLKGKFAPQPLIVIDTFKQKLSEKQHLVSVVLTNKGNAVCAFTSISMGSKNRSNFIRAESHRIVKISRGGLGGNTIDIIAKDITPNEWGSIDLIFNKPTDIEFFDIKTESKSQYRYKQVYAIGSDISINIGQLTNTRTGEPIKK
jgi:hypothetical protein